MKEIEQKVTSRILGFPNSDTSLMTDTERLDWVQKNHAEITFEGVEAERIKGGSITKDYWKVSCGTRIFPNGDTKKLEYEANSIRDAIDKAIVGKQNEFK